jgi:hypothetical protein
MGPKIEITDDLKLCVDGKAVHDLSPYLKKNRRDIWWDRKALLRDLPADLGAVKNRIFKALSEKRKELVSKQGLPQALPKIEVNDDLQLYIDGKLVLSLEQFLKQNEKDIWWDRKGIRAALPEELRMFESAIFRVLLKKRKELLAKRAAQ